MTYAEKLAEFAVRASYNHLSEAGRLQCPEANLRRPGNPVKEFAGARVAIGCDRPTQAEPFNAQLRALPLERSSVAMRKAFAEARLALPKTLLRNSPLGCNGRGAPVR